MSSASSVAKRWRCTPAGDFLFLFFSSGRSDKRGVTWQLQQGEREKGRERPLVADRVNCTTVTGRIRIMIIMGWIYVALL